MLEANVGRLPVVDQAAPTHIVGYLSRGNIMEANLKRLQEEREVEAGWLLRRPALKPNGTPNSIVKAVNGK
jgi:hypothetical protein